MKNDNTNKNNEKNNNKYLWISVVALILIITIGIVSYFYMNNNKEEDTKNVAYTDLIKDVNEGKIEKIEMTVGSTSLKLKYRDEEEEKYAIVPKSLLKSKVFY